MLLRYRVLRHGEVDSYFRVAVKFVCDQRLKCCPKVIILYLLKRHETFIGVPNPLENCR